MKTVYLISHDDHFDHRISFFEKYFVAQGYQAFHFLNEISFFNDFFDFEKENFIRPNKKEIFYDFNVNCEHQHSKIQKAPLEMQHALTIALEAIEVLETYRGEKSLNLVLDKFLKKHFLFKNDMKYCIEKEDFAFILRFNFSHLYFYFDTRQAKIIVYHPALKGQRDLTKFDLNVFDTRVMEAAIDNAIEDKIIPRPDMIYVADLPTLPLGIRFKHKLKVPLIFDAHEWWAEQYRIWGPKDQSQFEEIDKLEVELCKQVDLAVTVSRKLASMMASHIGIPFHEVYTTVIDFLEKPKVELDVYWKSKITNYQNEKVILFQGSLTTHRSLDLLAKNTKFIPEKYLLGVAGRGSYEDEFIGICKTEGDFSKVRILGWQSQNSLFELTRNAWVGVIPYIAKSKYFAVAAPNKLFEYIFAEIPIVYDQSMEEIGSIVEEFSIGAGVDFREPSSLSFAIEKINNLRQSSTLSDSFHQAKIKLSYEGQQIIFHTLIQKLNL